MNRKSKSAEFVEEGYDIHITGRNVQVTDTMKEYAIEKISKIDRLGHRFIEVTVIMDIQKLEHRCDITLWVDNTKIKVSSSSESMYASIDLGVDKLKAKLRRFKERVRDHQSISHADVAMNVNVYSPSHDLLDVNEDIEEENQRRLMQKYAPHQIVSKESKPLKTLNNKEAIFKMELSGDAFMVYRSEEDRKLKVIYRRDDGNFGMIEPE